MSNTTTKSAVPKISALYKGPDGQKPDLTNLPPEHEIHLIDEAREYYTSERPIFLVDDSKNKLKKPTVNYACLAIPGQMGASGARVSVITRAWCNERVYQTIDLNRKRIIVKLFKGGPRGCFYRRWMGVIDGFEKPPIAYAVNVRRSDLVTSDAKPATVRKRKSIPSRVIDSDSSEAEYVPRKRSVNTNPLREKRLRDLENSPHATANGSSQIDLPLDLAPSATRNPPYTPASLPSATALPVKIKKEPGASELRLRIPAAVPSKTPSGVPVQPANTLSVRSQAHHSSNENIPSRLAAPSSSGENFSREVPQPKQAAATSTIASSSKTAAMPPDEYEDLVSNFLFSPILDSNKASSSTNVVPQPEVAASSSSSSSLAPITLSPEKQAATILSVYLKQDEDYVPLYLRSCMTISRFFDSCLGAFELADQPEKISALRVRLDHDTTTGSVASTAGTRREIGWLIKRNVPDSFDIFLGAVNKWAGWQDRDSCDVRVDIMLRAR